MIFARRLNNVRKCKISKLMQPRISEIQGEKYSFKQFVCFEFLVTGFTNFSL